MARQASGGHGVGITRVRQVRVSDEVWQAAQERAAEKGETVSEVIRRALIRYAGVKGTDGLAEPKGD